MPDALYPWLHIAGRVLFSMIFVTMGLMHLMKPDDLARMAESRGVPAAKAATLLSGLMILAGGLMVLLGWHRFIGAGLIAIFLFLTAMLIHTFWKETDETAKMVGMSMFMKDLALAGAALLIAYYSGLSWPLSLGG